MRFCSLCRRSAPAGATICSYDGHPLMGEVAIEPSPGVMIGEYRLFDVVAHGDVGTVYRAEDSSSGSLVALKLLSTDLASTPAVMHRVRRETKNAIKLANPNVARVLDCGDHEGHFYIVREWLEGHPLSVALIEEGPLSVERASTIANQICIALGLIHRVGLFHRDLKPNHVFLAKEPSGEWVVKLIDIGIAAKIDGIETTREIFGTPSYLSPEQAVGKLVNFRSDLYSLGCIFIEMLTGAPPFAGTPQQLKDQHQSTTPNDVRQLRNDVPEPLAQIITKLLSKQAAARPISAAMVQRELERAIPACKNPLEPVVTGRGGVSMSARPSAAPPVPASVAAPVAAAPVAAAPSANDDMGMAATLFGNFEPDTLPSIPAGHASTSQAVPSPSGAVQSWSTSSALATQQDIQAAQEGRGSTTPPPPPAHGVPAPQIQLPPPSRPPSAPPMQQQPLSQYTPPPAQVSPSQPPSLYTPPPAQQSAQVSPVPMPAQQQAQEQQTPGFIPVHGAQAGVDNKKTIMGMPVITAEQIAAVKSSSPPEALSPSSSPAPAQALQPPMEQPSAPQGQAFQAQPSFGQTPGQYQTPTSTQPQYGPIAGAQNGPIAGAQNQKEKPIKKMAATMVVNGSDPVAMQAMQSAYQQQQYPQGPALHSQGGPASNEMPTTDELRREFKKSSGIKIAIVIVVLLIVVLLFTAMGFASCLFGARASGAILSPETPARIVDATSEITKVDEVDSRS